MLLRKAIKWGCLFWGVLFATSLAASLVWETRVIEERAAMDADVIEAAFVFRVEESPVTIRNIRSSCGCTTAALPKSTYLPGEEGAIEVRFELGARVGSQRMRIVLETDDEKEPQVELQLNVEIPHVVQMEPRFLYWEKGREPYETQSILLRIDVDEPIEIASIRSDQDQLKVTWERIESQTIRVDLTPVIPEGENAFFRAVLRIDLKSEGVDLRRSSFYAYAFMKN